MSETGETGDTGDTSGGSGATADQALRLQIWLSPAFPVGSFAYSHGLEWAAGTGRVHDRVSAEAWLCDLVRHGAMRNDAILLAHAWRAAREEDGAGLRSVNELALAMAGSRERFLETTLQGNAFLAAILSAWSGARLETLRRVLAGDVAYAVAVGAVTSAHGLPLPSVLTAYLAATAQNLVSALVRLSVIGQTDGQRVIATLAPLLGRLAVEAATLSLDDIGGAVFLSDIAAMAHETQETRLFRS
jgi:urease accessory protein